MIDVGDLVHYWPRHTEAGPFPDGKPLAALITYIHTDGKVNLFVFSVEGDSHTVVNVPFKADRVVSECGYACPRKVAEAEEPVVRGRRKVKDE